MKILHIDDDADHRLIVSLIIADHNPGGVELVQVPSAADADAVVGLLDADASFVLSDHMMPGERGASFLARHAAELAKKRIPCYLLTSYPDDPEVKEALSSGITGVLEKPVSYEAFERRLLDILQPWWRPST